MKRMVYYDTDGDVCLECGHILIKDINITSEYKYTERYYCKECNRLYNTYYHRLSDGKIKASADVEGVSMKFKQDF